MEFLEKPKEKLLSEVINADNRKNLSHIYSNCPITSNILMDEKNKSEKELILINLKDNMRLENSPIDLSRSMEGAENGEYQFIIDKSSKKHESSEEYFRSSRSCECGNDKDRIHQIKSDSFLGYFRQVGILILLPLHV